MHIGGGKAGSSSIQNALVRNRQALLDCNVDPCVVHEEFPWFRPWAMCTYKNDRLDIESSVYAKYEKDIEFFHEQSSYEELLKGMIQRVEHSRKACMILSSEFFSEANLGRLRHRLTILRDLLNALSKNIELHLVYICRRQDALIESVYLQWFKPYYNVPFDSFKVHYWPQAASNDAPPPFYCLNYLEQKKVIEEMFDPPVGVKMLSFEKACVENGLLRSFECAVDLPEAVLEAQNQNQRREMVALDPFAVDILRFSAGMTDDEKKCLCDLFFKYRFQRSQNEQHRLLCFEKRRELYQYFYRSNQEAFGLNDAEMHEFYEPRKEREHPYSISSYENAARLLLHIKDVNPESKKINTHALRFATNKLRKLLQVWRRA